MSASDLSLPLSLPDQLKLMYTRSGCLSESSLFEYSPLVSTPAASQAGRPVCVLGRQLGSNVRGDELVLHYLWHALNLRKH